MLPGQRRGTRDVVEPSEAPRKFERAHIGGRGLQSDSCDVQEPVAKMLAGRRDAHHDVPRLWPPVTDQKEMVCKVRRQRPDCWLLPEAPTGLKRRRGVEDVLGEPQAQLDESPRTEGRCPVGDDTPIDRVVSAYQLADEANPLEPCPEVPRPMRTQHEQPVLRAEHPEIDASDGDAGEPRAEMRQIQGKMEAPGVETPVKLDHRPGYRVHKRMMVPRTTEHSGLRLSHGIEFSVSDLA